ncbi:hypothetical protein JD969_09225 [Planctomycetota bacterium]|nr:hypothetical protein JD969_09225 [Planctomycetota bacterium]
MSDNSTLLPNLTNTENIACKNCNYPLKSLEPKGDCPECGTPIQKSINSHYLTTQHSLTTILLRLLIIYCLMVYMLPFHIQIIAGLAALILPSSIMNVVDMSVSWPEFFLYSTLLSLETIIFITLFIYAPSITTKLFKPKGYVSINPHLNANEILGIGLALLGSYVCITAIINLVQVIYGLTYRNLAIGPDTTQLHDMYIPVFGNSTYELISPTIQIIIGNYLIIGRNTITHVIFKLRTAGTNRGSNAS